MRIALLGGNGLLGHNVLKQLLQQGHEIHALLRNFSALHVESFPRKETQLKLFQGSLLDDGQLDAVTQGCDAIINCAGVTDMSLLHYEEYLPVNRDLCDRLVRLMERQKIHCLVHTSTANTIGYGSKNHSADENMPMQIPFCKSFYALSKREGERILQDAAIQHPDWHIVIVNPGFMIGAFDTKPSSGKLLLASYRRPVMFVPKGGKSFIHVADVAAAIVNAIDKGVSGQRYLLTGQDMSLEEFYHLQSRICGYRQWLIPLSNGLLRFAGRLGDLLRLCGVRTQLSTRNVCQLMVYEYYDNTRACADILMPQTAIEHAISDFFIWYNNKDSK